MNTKLVILLYIFVIKLRLYYQTEVHFLETQNIIDFCRQRRSLIRHTLRAMQARVLCSAEVSYETEGNNFSIIS